MTGEKKDGFCLECRERFKGDPNASLCPDCLKKELKNMDNGDPSGYLYAAIEYRKRFKVNK